MLIAIVLAFGLFFLAGLSWTIRKLVQADNLPFETRYGVRTAKTTASEDAWSAGHRAALPLISTTAVLSTLGGASILLTSWFIRPTDSAIWTLLLVALISYVVTAAALGGAFYLANSAAASLGEPDQAPVAKESSATASA